MTPGLKGEGIKIESKRNEENQVGEKEFLFIQVLPIINKSKKGSF